MQIWTNTIPLDTNNIFLQRFFTEHTLFCDIETTGFSPVASSLYLIGCATRYGEHIRIEQYFAENPDEEAMVLSHFFTRLAQYETMITFNGLTFDLPYLKAKCAAYQLPDVFSQKNNLDLFKIVSSLKFLLKLPNYKQKTIEQFLGIAREDSFNGGELIAVYQTYIRHPSAKQMQLLKQHNYEDVLGMPDLLPILSYSELFKGNYRFLSIESNLYTDYDGQAQKELIFTLQSHLPFPRQTSYRYEEFYLTCNAETVKLSVRLYEGTLKYFFENYKDYYYLPDENRAIHKDIAASVDKAYRKKATASTCYTKKTSLFLPQYQAIVMPAFFKERKDKLSYFELSEAFVQSGQQIKTYIDHILALMAKQKH